MSGKRISTITLVLVVVVLTAAGSWIAGSTIKSPAEVAARTAPPTPSPILVPVEERVLTSDIVTRGTGRYSLPQPISIVPSALKPNAGVISTLPVRNAQLQEGDVMLTASGRPVFVLQGEVPTYRDLAPGLSGDDVRQLETGLKRLGFDPGPVDGTYDEQTSTAVADWYAAAGFEPFGPTAEQLANIRTLEQELAVAINSKLAAEAAVAVAALTVESTRANANNANKVAEADVVVKTAARDKAVADPIATAYDRANADAELAVAQAAVESTRLGGEVDIQAALDAQAAAEREAKLANDVAVRIAADLDIAQRRTGVQVPADEIVFFPTVPVRVEQINVVAGDTVSGPVLTVTNNQLVIDSSLRLEESPLVKPGMAVAIDEPDLGLKATGTVSKVADTPGTFGVDGFHIYLEILVDETPLPLEGVSLRLTIPVESSGGTVTTVPISALSLAADGTSRVQVDNNGSLEFIVVEPGLSAGGFVEVTPIDGTISPGQLVVVGYEKK
jgi:peptidoglycan hydrolase-like protein with peptidoglycan-binding domain